MKYVFISLLTFIFSIFSHPLSAETEAATQGADTSVVTPAPLASSIEKTGAAPANIPVESAEPVAATPTNPADASSAPPVLSTPDPAAVPASPTSNPTAGSATGFPRDSTPAPEAPATDVAVTRGNNDGNETEAFEKRRDEINHLIGKLKHRSVAILTPIDYTSSSLGDVSTSDMRRELDTYGNPTVKSSSESIDSLTLQEFRKVIVHTKSEVVILSLIKPEVVVVYLFDRATPYSLYTAEESVPSQTSENLGNRDRLLETLHTAFIKTLQAYADDRQYEMPREHVASAEVMELVGTLNGAQTLLATMNKEFLSRYYFSFGYGGTIGVGQESNQLKLTTFNTLSGEAAVRLNDSLYLAGSLDSFCYNAISVMIKYISSNQDVPVRFGLGIGPSLGIDRSALAFDPEIVDGSKATWLVTTASLLVPALDVYIKTEAKLFIGVGGAKSFFSFSPGVTLLF